MTVLMSRAPLAFDAGILTVGVVPNAPVTATDPFGFDAVDGDDDDPQPARTMTARSGTESAAAMRRMRDLVVGIMSAASLPAVNTAGPLMPDGPAGQPGSVQAGEQIPVPYQHGAGADGIDPGGLAERGPHVKGPRIGEPGGAG